VREFLVIYTPAVGKTFNVSWKWYIQLPFIVLYVIADCVIWSINVSN